MPAPPRVVPVSLHPQQRVQAMDVNASLQQSGADLLQTHAQVLYFAHHTTAGFVEPLPENPFPDQRAVRDHVEPFRTLFPFGADYKHDEMDRRRELSPQQRECEPRNADAHLVYIGAGLTPCASYPAAPDRPVYLLDLDGVNQDTGRQRLRRVTALGFTTEQQVSSASISVPSQRATSVGLRDPRFGLFDTLYAHLARHEVQYGRIRLQVSSTTGAALTVNEYEPLLMEQDLERALQSPRCFQRENATVYSNSHSNSHEHQSASGGNRHTSAPIKQPFASGRPPRPATASGVDSNSRGDSNHALLDLRDYVDLMVVPDEQNQQGRIVQGRYQSPILLRSASAPATVQVRASIYRCV